MKLDKKTVSSILIVGGLGLLVIAMIALGFWKGPYDIFQKPVIPASYYRCGNTLVPFRANITDCDAFPLEPDALAFKQLVLNPMADQVFILVDPKGSVSLGNSIYELHKTFKGLLIPSGVVYTEVHENQTTIPVLSIEDATPLNPIIWLQENQGKNLVEVVNNSVFVYAKTPYDMDAATCKLAIIAINDRFDCSYKQTD